MKKLLFMAAFAFFGAASAQSGFKLGGHVGLPVGDVSDLSGFTLGLDASYLWPVSADVNLGIASGYSTYFPKSEFKDFGAENLNLVPLAGSLQYRFTPTFSLGVDLGYGFLFSDGESDGGFYYQPKAAYHFGASEVNLAYQGVTKDGSTISAITLGYAYSFGK